MSDHSPPAESADAGHPPRDYLGWSLLATVFCFLPLGIVSLYYGFKTNRAMAAGRRDVAIHESHVTRGWLVATIVIGVVVYVFLAAVFAVLGAFSD